MPITRKKICHCGGLLLGAALLLSVSGCVTTPPRSPENLCRIFEEKDDWYKAAKRSEKKWGVPMQIQMAIIYQESGFRGRAKPPRKKLFGLIPTVRPSSAYGYAQVKDGTWDWYRDKSGNGIASRANFADAIDFVGWYGDRSQKMVGISKWDARNQYLAYHEGHGGYRKKSYRKKQWLVRVADKVKARADRYGAQLKGCRDDLDSGWDLWPFW
ncbi:MAG: transglycosylase SLT domain-containing protein [Gammaproteobacteria bacterium]